jgi:hypothetical protein
VSATKTKKKAEPTDAEVISQVQTNPGCVLTDSAVWNAFIGAVNREAADFKGDVKTEKGRDAITAKAFRFVKFRTGIEKARKDMTEDWRKQTEAVNKVGKTARETLQAIEDKISLPLDAWKEAKKTREAEIQETIARFRSYAGPVSADDTPESVMERLTWVRGINDLNEEQYGEWLVVAENDQRLAIAALEAAHARLVQEAKDREDLRLFREAQARQEEERQAAAQRQAQAEHDARVAKEAAEQATRDQAAALERAEQQRLAAEQEAERMKVQREADRIANIQRRLDGIPLVKGVGQQSSMELNRRLQNLQDISWESFEEFAGAAQTAICQEIEIVVGLIKEEQGREAEQAEADRQAQEAREERIRQMAIETERARAAAPPVNPTRTRENAVNRAAVAAIMVEAKCSEITARAVVAAIVQGKVPAVSISYAP